MDKKRKILESAKELFIKCGFKKTNISNIMKKAELGTGTFYNYYSSKDTIFMEIFLKENIKMKKEIIKKINYEDEPMDVMKNLMEMNLKEMYSNPILIEWYNKESFEKIQKKYIEENGNQNFDFMYSFLIDIIEKWQKNGKIRKDIPADMIMAIFSAIINIDTHKEEIGLEYFPEIQEYISEFVMKGLEEKN